MGINLKSTDRVTVCGLPGQGKTTFAKYLAALMEPNILIWDPLDQYDGFPDELRYIPKSDTKEEFESVCKKMCMRGNVTFFIEEAEKYLRQGQNLGPYGFDLVNRGRNWGVGIVAVTRRVQLLSKDFFDLSAHAFIFRPGLKSYGYLEEFIGRQNIAKVHALKPFEFLHYALETEEATVGQLRISGHHTALKQEGQPEPKAEARNVAVSGNGKAPALPRPAAPAPEVKPEAPLPPEVKPAPPVAA